MYDVEISSAGGDRISRIYRRLGNDVTSLIEFSPERIASAGFSLPRSQVVTVYDHQQKYDQHLVARIEYEIEKLEINHGLPQGVFTIPFDEAHSVWDGDARAFLKQRGDPRRVFVPLPIDE